MEAMFDAVAVAVAVAVDNGCGAALRLWANPHRALLRKPKGFASPSHRWRLGLSVTIVSENRHWQPKMSGR
jgi:hypothetical protein